MIVTPTHQNVSFKSNFTPKDTLKIIHILLIITNIKCISMFSVITTLEQMLILIQLQMTAVNQMLLSLQIYTCANLLTKIFIALMDIMNNLTENYKQKEVQTQYLFIKLKRIMQPMYLLWKSNKQNYLTEKEKLFQITKNLISLVLQVMLDLNSMLECPILMKYKLLFTQN